MKKWNMPLTYQPKIEPVKAGTCTQTIRIGNKFHEGDLIRFYVWEGKPYRSKRTTITEYMSIYFKADIIIFPWGFRVTNDFLWETWEADIVAKWDGIVPPTGVALRDVLIEKNGAIPAEGIRAQIIRWTP